MGAGVFSSVKREFGDVESTDPRDIALCKQARDRVHFIIHDGSGDPAGTAMVWLGERPRAESEPKGSPVTTGWIHEVRTLSLTWMPTHLNSPPFLTASPRRLSGSGLLSCRHDLNCSCGC